MIELLVANGASATIKNNHQMIALHALLFRSCHSPEDVEKLKIFLEKNPFIVEKLIHATDEQHNNQLHLCAPFNFFSAYSGFKEYLSFLVSKNVSIHARNNHGKKAIDLMYERYHTSYNQYML